MLPPIPLKYFMPLMLAVCHMKPKRLLLAVLALFTAGQIGSGLATSFTMLMAARIAVACAHAIFWSITAPYATRLVTRIHQPFALSSVATGSAINPSCAIFFLITAGTPATMLLSGTSLVMTLPAIDERTLPQRREVPTIIEIDRCQHRDAIRHFAPQ